ncbi:Crp/Fnr family transcriptional regulator [Apibacter raozihei]|uniref:Crp/Fnr family transcriptional regulator n=1 Tax=Apibacter raozihei TaxID=2500547 RepID=UPI000FE308C9|nr:Crp/Fnr family transcriptional regulator [Apibacter raozihei]
MYQKLFTDISKIKQLSERDYNIGKQLFEPVFYNKKTVIEESNYIPKYLYYINSGYLRLFYYDSNRNDITQHINCPTDFFCSFSDFLNQHPSFASIECLTDCKLLRISRIDYKNLTEQSILWKNYALLVLQESMSFHEKRIIEMTSMNAQSRYLQLLENQPDIFEHVPLQCIASYLGIKPGSLSRIRKNLLNNC